MHHLNLHVRMRKAIMSDDVQELLTHVDLCEAKIHKVNWAECCVKYDAAKCFEALYRVDDYYLEDAYSQHTWRLVRILQKPPTMARAHMFITSLQMGANVSTQWDFQRLVASVLPNGSKVSTRPGTMSVQAFLCLDERGWQPLWDLWITWTLSIHDQLACFPTPLAALIHDYILQ